MEDNQGRFAGQATDLVEGQRIFGSYVEYPHPVVKDSMEEFGDLSGLVYNVRSGNLVCGHQRKKNLPADAKIMNYRRAKDKKGTVGYGSVVSDGVRWRIRFVDWEKKKEIAANIAGNSDELSGDFTEGLGDLVKMLEKEMPVQSKKLRFDQIKVMKIGRDGWRGLPVD